MSEDKQPDSFHIVVLDDMDTTCKLVAMALKNRLGCRVSTFNQKEQLMAMKDSEPPDLYLLDFGIDGDNGLQFFEELKAREAARGVPVMFFSEKGEPQLRAEAIKAGGVDYMEKPFFPEELVARVRAHINLHRSRQQILAQLNEQQALMRVLCHDLKNPVAAVFSLLEMMKEEGEESELLELALQSTDSALGLIQHVSEYRILADARQHFERELITVQRAFDESEFIVRTMSERKGVMVLKDVEPQTTVFINKVVFVHNILNNLLTNAIKFSHPGGEVILRGRTRGEGAEQKTVIEVIDGGIGMSKSMLAELFETGKVQSRPGTAEEPGTGFGMPLVKLYVQKSGGEIEVDSVLGTDSEDGLSGTTVRLILPSLHL